MTGIRPKIWGGSELTAICRRWRRRVTADGHTAGRFRSARRRGDRTSISTRAATHYAITADGSARIQWVSEAVIGDAEDEAEIAESRRWTPIGLETELEANLSAFTVSSDRSVCCLWGTEIVIADALSARSIGVSIYGHSYPETYRQHSLSVKAVGVPLGSFPGLIWSILAGQRRFMRPRIRSIGLGTA